MKSFHQRFIAVFACIFLSSIVYGSEEQGILALVADEERMAGQALAILDGWHKVDAKPGDRRLHVVVWTPSDREPPAEYQARLTRMMEHIQAFYLREMERNGFGARTIQLDYEAEGRLRVHVVRGAGPDAEYEGSSGHKIRRECLPVLREKGINGEQETLVIFCNLATWDEEKKHFTHKSPYYASGNQRGGTAWQLDSPQLDVPNLLAKEPLIRDGQYGRISLGKHNSIFIGGIAHELGHALGLPHVAEQPIEKATRGTALMGSGNRTYGDELRGEGKGSFLTFAHAMRLASHPQFSGSVKGMNDRHTATFQEIEFLPEGAGFAVEGRVLGTVPVYGVVAYFDPDGGSDYDAVSVSTVPDHEGRFRISSQYLTPGKSAAVRLVACLVNGATSQFSRPYTVRKDGSVDLESIFLVEILAGVRAAVNGKKPAAAVMGESLVVKPHYGPELIEKAERIRVRLAGSLAPRRSIRSLLEVESALSTVVLSDVVPAAASVGWLSPTYDRVPEELVVLSSGGLTFEHGIYAHAPARHAYTLDGTWKFLAGRAGLSGASSGSVVFVVKADDREVWRSRVIKTGQLAQYHVAMDGVKNLELLVEDGGDGNGSDWGVWLEPVLTR